MERLWYNTGFYEVFHTKNKEEHHKIKNEWTDVMFYQIYMQSNFFFQKWCVFFLYIVIYFMNGALDKQRELTYTV